MAMGGDGGDGGEGGGGGQKGYQQDLHEIIDRIIQDLDRLRGILRSVLPADDYRLRRLLGIIDGVEAIIRALCASPQKDYYPELD
jgi:hypothetical protein